MTTRRSKLHNNMSTIQRSKRHCNMLLLVLFVLLSCCFESVAASSSFCTKEEPVLEPCTSKTNRQRQLQQPVYGYLPCSICGPEEVMMNVSSNIPPGTLSWLSDANDPVTCFKMELLGSTSSLSLSQCSEIVSSIVPTAEVCGCMTKSAPSVNTTTAPIAAPTTTTAPIADPTTTTTAPAAAPITTTNTPSVVVAAPVAVPTTMTTTAPALSTSAPVSNMMQMNAEIKIRLMSVATTMNDEVRTAYSDMLSKFFDQFLNGNDYDTPKPIVNVTATMIQQTLLNTTSSGRRLTQSTTIAKTQRLMDQYIKEPIRELRRKLQDNKNDSLFPLDTIVNVTGYITSSASMNFNDVLLLIVNEHYNVLINDYMKGSDSTLVQFYFNQVTTMIASDPVAAPTTTNEVPTAPSPTMTWQPNRYDEPKDGLSAGGIAGIAVGSMLAVIVIVMLIAGINKGSDFYNTEGGGGGGTASYSGRSDTTSVVTLDKHTDPFAKREGRTLVWKDVNMVLASKKGEGDRHLLKDVWGEVPSKETTAIMGPSGAGKSSLLNILAGRASSHGLVKIESDIRLNNYSVDPTNIEVRRYIAFVAQDDSLQVTATPREAIRFSAKLRLSRTVNDSELDKLTERVITELGLVSCADTIVGGALIKGISGGERKRTSVGVELVVKPALIFLDEPTSGLDSFSAVQLCQVLKKVANAGASVLFTIHQPSSEIFNSFDRLILLNKGRVMYQGSVDGVPTYFGDRGHPNPKNYNPADWVMQVAQSVKMDELDDAGFFPTDDRDIGEAFMTDSSRDALGITNTKHPNGNIESRDLDAPPPGMGTQIGLLFTREMNNLKRDTTAVGARFGLSIFLGVLIGVIFFDVGDSDPASPQNLNSRFGALVMVLLMSMFGTAQPALLAFPQERPVFLREYSTNHYSVISYFMARFTVEAFITGLQCVVIVLVTYYLIQFQADIGIMYVTVYTLAMASTALAVLLGCAVEDPKLGQEFLPILFVPQMLFAGFFVRPELIPKWLRWPQYLCSLTYGVRIMLVAEFQDCSDDTSNPGASRNCKFLLTSVKANEDETWWNWLVLIGLFVVFRFTAVVVLRSKATKFY